MEKKNNLVSFIQAYMLSLISLNEVVGVMLKKSTGVMIINLALVAGLIAIHFFVSDKKNDLNMGKKKLLFVYYIVSVIVIYKYASSKTTLEYEEVMAYIFIPIYISFYKVDTEKLLKYMLLISALFIPFSETIFGAREFAYETIGMSTAYNILPFVVAAIIHFWYYRKSAGFLTWIGYSINVYYLFMVVLYGNRGPIISLLTLAILLLLHKFDENDQMKKNKTKTVVITILVGIAVVLLVNNVETIIYQVNEGLNSVGIKISALEKSILTIDRGDLSNGRDTIFKFTVEGIKENPFLGNGIASMFIHSFYTIAYPHNLFLQMWYDLGVFVSIPLLWVTIKAIIKTVFSTTLSKQYATMLILLFTISIPRLCYSAEFWCDISFWLLLMYTISPNLYGENKTNELKSEEAKGMVLADERKSL